MTGKEIVQEYLRYDNGIPTSHTIQCFIGMIETGEVDISVLRELVTDDVLGLVIQGVDWDWVTSQGYCKG